MLATVHERGQTGHERGESDGLGGCTRRRLHGTAWDEQLSAFHGYASIRARVRIRAPRGWGRAYLSGPRQDARAVSL